MVLYYVLFFGCSSGAYQNTYNRVPSKQEKYLEFLPAGKTRGIKKCGKIQGKHREFVCLRSKFIALGGGYIGPLLNSHSTCNFCTQFTGKLPK